MNEPTYIDNMRALVAELSAKNAELEAALSEATQQNMDQALRLAEALEDTARIETLESLALDAERVGNGVVIMPMTLTATGERQWDIDELGNEDGSNLGGEISNGFTLRAALDAARKEGK